MKTITLRQLKSLKACPEQVMKFKTVFGKSVEITPELTIQVASLFDWDWIAHNLLSAAALKVYNETRAAAWKVYKDTKNIYDDITVSALKVYDETRAKTFANLYINDNWKG